MSDVVEQVADAVQALANIEAEKKAKRKSWEERDAEREAREVEHHKNYQAELASAGFHRQLASEFWQKELENVSAHRAHTDAINDRNVANNERDVESAIVHRIVAEKHWAEMERIARQNMEQERQQVVVMERQAEALERIAAAMEHPVKILASSMEEKP